MAEEPAAGSTRGEDPARGPARAGDGQAGDGQAGRTAARGFATGDPLDQAPPSAWLTRALERASGPGWCCPGASDDELIGVLGRWEATEAWCAAAKLGVIRELVRRREREGGLSSACAEGLVQEVSNVLEVSLRAADELIHLAWALDARLPATATALAAGVISLTKARIIAHATAVLDDAQVAAAERLIADRLAGKTPGQIAAMIARAVVEVDPDGARKRREAAEREEARVRFWREHAGTAALAAFGLPPEEALAANQHIQDRAVAYRAAGMTGTLDQLRVRAFLDALTGTDSRPVSCDPDTGTSPAADQDGCASGHGQEDDPARENADRTNWGRNARPGVAANIMLTIPLTTLLGLADRPGDAPGLGALDPALARQLAASAARNPRSQWCVTVTDDQGHAVAHGCAKRARTKRGSARGGPGVRDGPGSTGPGSTFALADDRGPPGYGSWQLTIGERDYIISLIPIPVTDCDHRYESPGYRPGALLRHLVEVRDGQCTQPTCVRAARRCDFEHAVPWDKGGRTCGCNCGCRCRRDHQVKQSPGWKVTQPRPGWHEWTTPAGRAYTTEPMRYPI